MSRNISPLNGLLVTFPPWEKLLADSAAKLPTIPPPRLRRATSLYAREAGGTPWEKLLAAGAAKPLHPPSPPQRAKQPPPQVENPR